MTKPILETVSCHFNVTKNDGPYIDVYLTTKPSVQLSLGDLAVGDEETIPVEYTVSDANP